jgi:hypothetical protein
MQEFLKRYLIPKIDKLEHFFLWSIFLAACLHFKSDVNSYILCVGSSILWELIQKLNKGKNSFKEMCLDIFFGGILPCILHFIS